MSGGSDKLSLKEDDVTKMLAATTHIGSTNVDFQMEQYVYKRRSDGNFHSFHLLQNMLIENIHLCRCPHHQLAQDL